MFWKRKKKAPPSLPTRQFSRSDISPEVYQYLSDILDDAGMTFPDKEFREEMIIELFGRLDNYLTAVIVDNMPEKHIETFIRMNEQGKSRTEIEAFMLKNYA